MNSELIPPHMQLAIMSREYVLSRSIHAIAHLGIADHMSDEPISVAELASNTGTVADILDRVLTFLTGYGLFIKTSDGYALTPLSHPLKQDDPNSIKDVLAMFDESWWQAFAHLETSIKSGVPGFQQQHGTSFFNFLNDNPEKKTSFQQGLAKLASYDNKAIIQAFDFAPYNHLAIIGEHQERLEQAIKDAYPSLKVTTHHTYQDLPEADAYLMKGLLHDFADEKVKQILKECHQNMNPKASVLIAEQVIPDNNLPHTNKTMDIVMMVLVGGRQRTLNDWQQLIETCGFVLQEAIQTQGVYSVMEFLIEE